MHHSATSWWTESKYITVTHPTKEALWLISLIEQIFSTKVIPIKLYSDNQSAIALAKDHQYHAWTKHINICYHFICWVVDEGSIQLIYCPTDNMVADMLTKALPSAKVKHFAMQLGLLPPWGGVLDYKVPTPSGVDWPAPRTFVSPVISSAP